MTTCAYFSFINHNHVLVFMFLNINQVNEENQLQVSAKHDPTLLLLSLPKTFLCLYS